MDRNRQTLTAIRMAFVLVLVAASCTGCGQSMLYHFKHYHRPFAAIAQSNKTYFHSSQTGKIIEKNPCQQYCEPGCLGYEPTCWTPWPTECAGNCPLPGGVVEQVMPYDGQIIMEGGTVMDSMADPHEPSYQVQAINPSPAGTGIQQPALPALDETLLPAIRVPSIPTDVESAIPSPSDSTQLLTPQPVRVPHMDAATRIANAKPVQEHAMSITRVKLPESLKVVPPKIVHNELPLGLVDQIETAVAAPVEEAIKPIRVARSSRHETRVVEPTAKAAEQGIAPKLDQASSSRRRPKSLADKLRVRSTSSVAKDYLSTIEATGTPDSPLSEKLDSEKSQPAKMILIVEAQTRRTKAKSEVKQSLPTSTVKFGDVASKLKNAKPVAVEPSKAKALPKTINTPQEFEAAEAKSTVATKKTALRVSDGGSSVVRFARNAPTLKRRLTANPDSTVLKFTTDD